LSRSPGRRLVRAAGLAALAAAIAAPTADAAITQTHLSFTGDTSTTMAVSFKEDAADPATTATGYARPAAGAGGAAACATAAAPADCIAIPLARTDAQGVAGTGPAYTFFAGTFRDLRPGSSYDWFVTTTQTPGGAAPGRFTTAAGGDAPYTAATYGEVHTDDGDDVVAFGASGPGDYSVQGVVGLNRANQVLLNQNVRPAFVVSSGDNQNDGSNETMWDRLLSGTYTYPDGTVMDGSATRTLLGGTPFLSALGDHEYKNTAVAGTASPLYYAHFPNPANGPAGQENRSYSYDYNGVHWVVLEASPGRQPSKYGSSWQAELAWLDVDLASAVTRTRFQVVVMHQPPFHSKTSRVYPTYADPEFRDDVMPLFDRYGVEVVVSGHDAHNVRSFPLVGRPTPDWTPGQPKVSPLIVGPGEGTTYLEQSTTGKNYDGLLDSEPWVAWSQSVATMPAMLLFTFGERTITASFVRTDALDPVTHTLLPTGEPVDRFTIPRVDAQPATAPGPQPAGPGSGAGSAATDASTAPVPAPIPAPIAAPAPATGTPAPAATTPKAAKLRAACTLRTARRGGAQSLTCAISGGRASASGRTIVVRRGGTTYARGTAAKPLAVRRRLRAGATYTVSVAGLGSVRVRLG
jgi:hypothetical protein